jgi:hypothetical protein
MSARPPVESLAFAASLVAASRKPGRTRLEAEMI